MTNLPGADLNAACSGPLGRVFKSNQRTNSLKYGGYRRKKRRNGYKLSNRTSKRTKLHFSSCQFSPCSLLFAPLSDRQPGI
ncbi:hypothetical protein F6Q07_01395 [Pectobacterium parmentieri]|nr:hypothetical protein [Pectobacterium parmentieri]